MEVAGEGAMRMTSSRGLHLTFFFIKPTQNRKLEEKKQERQEKELRDLKVGDRART